jgi:hypothetical protein
MVTLVNQYYPDLDKTVKGNLKGQCQGIRSTTQKAFQKNIENKLIRIKIKGKKITFQSHPTHQNLQSFLLHGGPH